MYLDPENPGGHCLREKRWAAGTVAVECIGLAELLGEIGRDVDLLKIDAQGSEYDLLFACPELLAQCVRSLVVKAHRTPHGSGQDLANYLTRLGFSVSTKGEAGLLLIRAQNQTKIRSSISIPAARRAPCAAANA